MENGLSQSLQAKISKLDAQQPWVWQLRMSETDFKELEAAIGQSIEEHHGDHAHLLTQEWAKSTIVYMAEWYKRRYQSGNTNDMLQLDSTELEKLWAEAGINTKLFLYTDESGKRRWQYSTYVLGGLAIRHELNRNDGFRFLKGLCRIYHGENFTLENLDDQSRAVAFRESIRQKHSLYAYMREILEGHLPFSSDDLSNERSETSRFITAIKTANEEVLRQKFSFEWVVTFTPQAEYMSRRLRIRLKPEEVGGGLHQYLRYDRVRIWGIPNPERQKALKISIRFLDDSAIVSDVDFEHPLVAYSNTGEIETGFVAWGIQSCAVCQHVPTHHFSKYQIVVQDDEGKEHIAQEQKASEYMQMWRIDQWGDEWSSIQSSQKQTALVFSHRCHLHKNGSEEVAEIRFHDKLFGRSEIYGWHYIYDCATLDDERGKQLTFYNRQGYDVVTTRLYSDTIRYYQGGFVKYYFMDDPDLDDDLIEEYHPLIFGLQDIIVRHFKTKDDIKNARPETDTTPELVEWQMSNGRYTVWAEGNAPKYGLVSLHIKVKCQCMSLSTLYLPPLNESMPIERDLKSQTVTYRDIDSGLPRFISDNVPMDFEPLAPTLEIKFGGNDNFVSLDIWRPLHLQEYCMGNKVVKYGKDDVAVIPYILKEELTFNEFNAKGYYSFDCSHLSSIYPLLSQETNANMEAWRLGTQFEAQALDAEAPASLRVVLGTAESKVGSGEGLTFLFWDYDKDKAPETSNYHKPTEKNTILFQSLASVNKDLTVAYAQTNFFPFTYGKVKQKLSILKCFEVAVEHRLYFFTLTPLVKLSKKEYFSDIYMPLLAKRDGHLTEADCVALRRFADEFKFSWAELNIDIETV